MGKTPKKSIGQIQISFGRVSLHEKSVFAKNLSVMLKSGMTLAEAIDVSEESARGKFQKVLRSLSKSIRAGNSLYDALMLHPKIFGGLFASSVFAGEASGTLEENLGHVAIQLDKERNMIAKIRGAMFYPLIVMAAAFIMALILSYVVLPKITSLFKGLRIELPITTRALIRFADFMDDYGIWFIIGVILSGLLVWWLMKRKLFHPITHWFLLHTYVIRGIVKNANLSRIARNLGTLLASGITIEEAISITRETSSHYYYRQALGEIESHVMTGSRLSDGMRMYPKLFPSMMVNMIRVGETSGSLDDSFEYLGSYYEGEVDESTKTLTTTIEPILLLIIGIVVGFFALSIITPIYEITGNVR